MSPPMRAVCDEEEGGLISSPLRCFAFTYEARENVSQVNAHEKA